MTELLLSPHLKALFSSAGYLPVSTVRTANSPLSYSLLFLNDAPSTVYCLYVLLVASTVSLIAGYRSRLASVLVFVLLLTFRNRTPPAFYGGDNVQQLLSFYLIFLDTGKAWAMGRNGSSKAVRTYVNGWAIRMMQFQLAILYLFTALYKIMENGQWVKGTFFFTIISYQPFALHEWLWLGSFPVFVNALTWFALVTELGFPFLVWFRQTRLYILGSAVILHLGTGFFLNVVLFGPIMISSYVVFLTDKEVERIRQVCSIIAIRIRRSQRSKGIALAD